MTALAVASALVASLCIGYGAGCHARSKPPTWKSRTSRMALGKRALSLAALVAARRIQRTVPVHLGLAAVVGSGLRLVEPRQLGRRRPPRRRFR